ncbi:pyridoxamine 5'-phosphate oxidase family protein [Actinoplanes sp. ATCC 53533]|uniref:pyridoxamine 5'-phosphate oxidase family protein n=1 Tax=Actinoplanes sp. ATCC 53533 TaxID=1288362 RepID=UPI001F468058|nr:pyridoxamine 5'-phosphate oxidase family protein [Actinoplanes sp. ATCC 53533]
MDGASLDAMQSCAIAGERLLQERLGTREQAERFHERQVLDHLNEPMCRFIARQEMMFLATSDGAGACDSTLRAGAPGFVTVLDERRLAWPEYRGNGVLASRGNIVENPHVGLLFVDFVRDGIGLHVNGGAVLTDDDDLREEFPALPTEVVPGRKPEQWVVAAVVEAYIHCAKFIPRLAAVPAQRDRRGADPQPKKSDYFIP